MPPETFYNWLNEHLSYPSPLGVLLLAASYMALVIGVRWQMIAQPIRNNIDARIQLLKAEAHRLKEGDPTRLAVLELVEDAAMSGGKRNLFDVVFWSRGKETALWQLVDKAESYLAYTWSTQKLLVRLISARAHLDALSSPSARALGARLARVDVPKDAPCAAPTHEELCELYREAVRLQRELLVEDDVESDYYNNKILWHILISLAAILFVANIAPRISTEMMSLPVGAYALGIDEQHRQAFILFLLAGAVGGILSRLTRALRAGASPAERGLSWMAMFLSPLVGALAGWAGTMLLLAGHQLHVLIPSVQGVELGSLLTSAAVLFGVSERMFTGLTDKLENKLLAEPRSAAEATPKGADAPAGTPTQQHA